MTSKDDEKKSAAAPQPKPKPKVEVDAPKVPDVPAPKSLRMNWMTLGAMVEQDLESLLADKNHTGKVRVINARVMRIISRQIINEYCRNN